MTKRELTDVQLGGTNVAELPEQPGEQLSEQTVSVAGLKDAMAAAERERFAEYVSLVNELVGDTKVDPKRVEWVLGASGRDLDQLTADVSLLKERLSWHKVLDDRRQLERDPEHRCQGVRRQRVGQLRGLEVRSTWDSRPSAFPRADIAPLGRGVAET